MAEFCPECGAYWRCELHAEVWERVSTNSVAYDFDEERRLVPVDVEWHGTLGTTITDDNIRRALEYLDDPDARAIFERQFPQNLA